MSRSVYASLRNEFFGGGNAPVQPKKEEASQKQEHKIQTDKQEPQSKTTSRKFNRSKDHTDQKAMRGVSSEGRRSNVQVEKFEYNSKKLIVLCLNRLFHVKLIDPFLKIKQLFILSYKNNLQRFRQLDHLIAYKMKIGLKKSFLKLASITNISEKQLSKTLNKNLSAQKMIQVSIGKSLLNKQLALAFSHIKKIFGKKTQKVITRQSRVLFNILNRLIVSSQRSAFEKLIKNKAQKSRNPRKIKLSLKILTKLLKQRVAISFNYIRFNNKNQQPQIGLNQSKKIRSSSVNKTGSFKQPRKRPSSQITQIQASLKQQTSLRDQIAEKFKEFDRFAELQSQLRNDIKQQAQKQESLMLKLSQKKQQSDEAQISINQQINDKLRAHPDDPIFFQKLKSIYLSLKSVDQQYVNREDFIQKHNLDFHKLFDHPQYLLAINRRLKNQVRRIEQFLVPSDAPRPNNKLMKDIQDIKQELAKQNEALKKSVSKYVAAAYDTQWLFIEAKKLQDELNEKINVEHD